MNDELYNLFKTKLPIVIYTLDEDFTRQQFIDEFGQGTTFPQVILNEERLGGCVDTVKYLRENNFV
jgi:glutaredoxin